MHGVLFNWDNQEKEYQGVDPESGTSMEFRLL